MKRFHFSLQAILTLRQRTEQKALEQYAGALLARDRATCQLAELRREQAEWWSRWRQEVGRGCQAAVLHQWRACNSNLNDRRQKAETALAMAEVTVNQALGSLLTARRDRESVEKHFERQHLAYTREVNREEQKRLDEIGQRRELPLTGRTARNCHD